MKRKFETFRYYFPKNTNPVSKALFYLCLAGCLGFSCSKAQESVQSDKEEIKDQTITTAVDVGVILFFGNSLTAGYGVDPDSAFPHLVQQKIDSLSLDYRVINAGLSGETTASGANRIEWVLREPVEIMILELGGNDGLRGIDPEETKRNLQEIIDRAKGKYPDIQIILAGMEAPPNMGEQYTSAFRSVFPEIADKNNLPLITFLLEGVGGEPQYNLEDGIHPNERGHQLVAENVWEILKPLL